MAGLVKKKGLDEDDGFFDEEGRKLLMKLNLDVVDISGSKWNNLDAIFGHPSGGKIYVGNASAAQSMDILTAHGIEYIVNCTNGGGAIPCYFPQLKYHIFPISHWSLHVDSSDESVLAFCGSMFQFIEEAISKGKAVLVHCLAGAHRAGTTGCACLMHFASLNHRDAIATAKRLRPIIDPIGQLPQFLQRLELAMVRKKDIELV